MDGSYFPNRPCHMSVSWFVISDQTAIGVGDFITSTNPDYQLECAAEMCFYLAALQRMHALCVDNEDATKINLHIASD